MGRATTLGLSWPVALRLGRVSNLPTVWTNVVAGAVLSDAALAPGPLITLTLALSLFYVAGMYLNDAFDAGYDRVHRPKRPIPAGDVAAATVFGVGGGLMAAGLALLVALGYSVVTDTRLCGFGVGVGLCIAILVYDIWHKGNPIGPVLMGICRVLVYLTAAATLAGAFPRPLLTNAVMAWSYLIGLTYAAKQEDLKEPGRLWPLVFLAAPFVYGLPVAAEGGVGLAIFLLFLAAVVYALWFMVRPGRPDIRRVVTVLIAAISLLDGLFIAGHGEPMLAGLAVAAFGLTLVLQRYVAGT